MQTGETPLQSEAVPDALRLEQCPGCGYALHGLPPRGACPECGRAYDDETIVLFGWADGTRNNTWNGSRSAFGVMLFIVGFQIFHSLLNVSLRGLNTGNTLGIISVVIWVALIAWMCWRRWNSDLPGPIQVHLSPHGCRQLDDPKSDRVPAFVPWAELNDVLIGEKADGRWRVRLRHKGPWWKLVRTPVDAIVRCTTEQGWALRDQIAAWREGQA